MRDAAGAIGSALPVDIADGTLSVGGAELKNLVELPFSAAGACKVTLVTVDGMTHVLTGAEISIDRGPDGEFIETLPAEFNPDAAG